jgi:hypothetical protein
MIAQDEEDDFERAEDQSSIAGDEARLKQDLPRISMLQRIESMQSEQTLVR